MKIHKTNKDLHLPLILSLLTLMISTGLFLFYYIIEFKTTPQVIFAFFFLVSLYLLLWVSFKPKWKGIASLLFAFFNASLLILLTFSSYAYEVSNGFANLLVFFIPFIILLYIVNKVMFLILPSSVKEKCDRVTRSIHEFISTYQRFIKNILIISIFINVVGIGYISVTITNAYNEIGQTYTFNELHTDELTNFNVCSRQGWSSYKLDENMSVELKELINDQEIRMTNIGPPTKGPLLFECPRADLFIITLYDEDEAQQIRLNFDLETHFYIRNKGYRFTDESIAAITTYMKENIYTSDEDWE